MEKFLFSCFILCLSFILNYLLFPISNLFSFCYCLDAVRDTSTSRVPGKRGRPRKDPTTKPNKKMIHRIMEAISNHPGEPILYASTTKGTMKLVVDGHHFRYSFRKGKYTIFQCCYKENKEECLVRVVTDQKLVYPLDGEHIHFVQATDKSVTSVKFALSGEEPKQENVTTITDLQNVQSNQTGGREQNTNPTLIVMRYGEEDAERSGLINTETSVKMSPQNQEQATANMPEYIARPIETNVKVENIPNQDSLEYTAELPNEQVAANSDVISSEEFREKIKKRLQKALLGKKK